jgi:hypothetical protein
MKHIYSTFIASAFLFASCKNEDTAQTDPRLVVPFTQQTASGLESQQAAIGATQNHNLFKENKTGTASSVVSGINPSHGQPNHRCDIAVGAPLKTTVNTNVPVQAGNIQSSPQMVVTAQPTTVKVTTPKGMNPPHGEKNHRCDIAVGEPLNTKVANNVAASSGQVSEQINVPSSSVPALLASDNEPPADGINPAHGKAGHRCDIAVGAALPKT